MKVKTLLEVTFLWGRFHVHEAVYKDRVRPVGYFTKAEMEEFNDYIVRYVQPDGDDIYIEIEEEEE